MDCSREASSRQVRLVSNVSAMHHPTKMKVDKSKHAVKRYVARSLCESCLKKTTKIAQKNKPLCKEIYI